MVSNYRLSRFLDGQQVFLGIHFYKVLHFTNQLYGCKRTSDVL